MKRKLTVMALVFAMLLAPVLSACNNGGGGKESGSKSNSAGKDGKQEITEFTAFLAVPGSEVNDDNEVKQIIAEKTGYKIKETWLTGQTETEAIGTMIAGDEYPDIIDGGVATKNLYEAGALVPLDDYIEKYPNIKNFLNEEQWDSLRQDDGKIYWIQQFGNIKGEDKTTTQTMGAFWIQARVLEWADYPEIVTLDQYFQLLEDYNKANPTMEDGTKNIPYTILCEGTKFFCLTGAPLELAGYPNEGSVYVDEETLKAVDYNTTDMTKRYYKKLNDGYKSGLVDPESFTQTYDEYIAKLSSGRVLGMHDQGWNFSNSVNAALTQAGLDKQGCDYIPIGLVFDEDIHNRWFTRQYTINTASGIGITKDCKDPDGVMKFMNDLLDQEIHDLRFWGVKGVDYDVNEKGEYFRTKEQRFESTNTSYRATHLCPYSWMPQYEGTSDDGINANKPSDQPGEFYDGLNDDIKRAFDAYGAKTYIDLLGVNEPAGPWYPLWTYSNAITTSTPGGIAFTKMDEVFHEYMPKVCIADDFEAMWDEFLKTYEECNPQDFLDEIQAILDKRIEDHKQYEN